MLCTDDTATLSEDERKLFSKNNISIREERIVRVEGRNGQLENIVFPNSERLARKAIFFRPKQHQHSELAKQLGCEFTDFGTVKVDDFAQTSVSGIYASGDMSGRGPTQQVAFAVSRGALAALARIIHEGSAASADTRLRWAVSPFSPSTYCMSMPQDFTAPSARLASCLHAFATSLHG